MDSSLKIAGIAGSLRSRSYSRIVLNTIVDLLPTASELVPVDIGALPHYNEDVELGELPQSVKAARATVSNADALVIVTPEFNHGVPGVLKNALDWLSRPAFNSCMLGKPVFFVTLSPGALGGVRAQLQLRETLASMLCRLVALPEVVITQIVTKVEDEALVDPASISFIDKTLQQFLAVAAPDIPNNAEVL